MRVKFNAIEKQKWINYKVYALIPTRKQESVQKTDTVYDVQTFDTLTEAIKYGKSLMKKYSGISDAKFVLIKDISIIDAYHIISEDRICI